MEDLIFQEVKSWRQSHLVYQATHISIDPPSGPTSPNPRKAVLGQGVQLLLTIAPRLTFSVGIKPTVFPEWPAPLRPTKAAYNQQTSGGGLHV